MNRKKQSVHVGADLVPKPVPNGTNRSHKQGPVSDLLNEALSDSSVMSLYHRACFPSSLICVCREVGAFSTTHYAQQSYGSYRWGEAENDREPSEVSGGGDEGLNSGLLVVIIDAKRASGRLWVCALPSKVPQSLCPE